MVKYFNARDKMCCRDHNRAGRLLNEDLQNFCLVNHPQVWTTIKMTEIDLSLFPVDNVPLTYWSIYPVILTALDIQHQHNPEKVSVPKTWLTQHAYREFYREHITTATINGIQRVYTTVYPFEKPILEPVDHQMQQQHKLSRDMEKN